MVVRWRNSFGHKTILKILLFGLFCPDVYFTEIWGCFVWVPAAVIYLSLVPCTKLYLLHVYLYNTCPVDFVSTFCMYLLCYSSLWWQVVIYLSLSHFRSRFSRQDTEGLKFCYMGSFNRIMIQMHLKWRCRRKEYSIEANLGSTLLSINLATRGKLYVRLCLQVWPAEGAEIAGQEMLKGNYISVSFQLKGIWS